MQINKSIKQMAILSLLISCFSYTTDVQATYYRKSGARSSSAEIIAPLIVLGIGTTISIASIAISTYFAYQRAQKQYELLKRFQDDPSYEYENLINDARNLYYDQCGSASTSLSNDYPVVWLEKDATSNKNHLWWMFFSSDMKKLSNNLNEVIQYLRNFDQFIDDRKKYNEAYRKQHYRDERLAIEREKLNQKRQQNKKR